MSKKTVPEEQVKELAKEIAARALEEVMRRPGGGGRPGLGYECNQNKFECLGRYDCTAPDSCLQRVDCPNEHNPPR